MQNAYIRMVLDVRERNTPNVIVVKKNDTARTLRIQLVDGNTAYTIGPECTAVMTALKADGTKLFNSCTVEDNVVVYPFTEQTCSCAGRMICEVRVIGSDGKMLTSASFTMVVQETAYTDGDTVSQGEADALALLVGQTTALRDELNRKLENGEFVGPQGPEGMQGPEGLQGPAGPQGPPGRDGAVGPQGPAGPKGADGTVSFEQLTPQQIESLRGPVGPRGANGLPGKDGAVGPAGPAGKDGAAGPTGPAGPQGIAGAIGPAGKSAYQIAVDGGFVGDEEAWLASLVGPRGPQGEKGATGQQGEQGPAGKDGATGAQGPQGPQGIPGKDGAAGPAGPSGKDGAAGPTGPAGPQGPPASLMGDAKGPINMNGNPISGLNPPTHGTEPVTKTDGDARYLQKAGGVPVPDRDDQAVPYGLVKLANSIVSIPEMHRNIFRGKNLGTSVTPEQLAKIRDGSFADLFVGDYWVINNVTWRIADIDYWLRCGDEELTKHHLVIVPDINLYRAQMNSTTNTTVGGYVGSEMYRGNLQMAKTTVTSAFGSAVLSHREYLTNAVKDGYPSAGSWYDSTVELPNECMMYGSYIFATSGYGSFVPSRQTINKSQLALFKLAPKFICNREWFWLRDVVSSAHFADVYSDGRASYDGAAGSRGVRVVFGIC